MAWLLRRYPTGLKFADPGSIDLNSTDGYGGQLESEWIRAFPTLKDLAKLSNHVYSIPKLPYNQLLPFELSDLDGWECIATAVLKDKNGYCGAAYLNKKFSQIVIAHKGTDGWKDWITDWNGIIRNKNDPQISMAYIFTKLVVNQLHDKNVTISVTGHSLGGWLAQICTLFIEYPALITQNAREKEFIEKNEADLTSQTPIKRYVAYHLHAVAFDSPGCRSALRRTIGGRYEPEMNIEFRVKIESLDITVVIAPSNTVNTYGEHVGYVIHLRITSLPAVSWFSSHGIEHAIEYLSPNNPEVFPEVFEVYDAQRRKPVEERGSRVIHNYWYIGHPNYCRANIFSLQEQEFLNRAQMLTKLEKDLKANRGNQLEVETFNSEDDADARTILGTLKAAGLTEYICRLRIKHGIIFIEFPQGQLYSGKYRMANFIWNFKELFKKNSWRTNTTLAKTISKLPTCAQSVCRKVGSEYLELIPEFCNDFETPESLGSTIKSFLENGKQRILNLDSGEGKRMSRICMIQIVHCLKSRFLEVWKENILFLSTFQLQSLVNSIGVKFKESKLELFVVEYDSKIDSTLIEAISNDVKLILVSNKDLRCIPNVNSSSTFDMTFRLDNLTELSQNTLKGCNVNIQGHIISLGKIEEGESKPFLLHDIAHFFAPSSLSPLASSELICNIFDGEGIELLNGNLPKMAENYIARTLYQTTLDIQKLRDSQGFSDVIVVSSDEAESMKGALGEDLYNKVDWKRGNYTKDDFLYYQAGSRNAHLFKHEKNVLVWQSSKGLPCSEYFREIKELDTLCEQDGMIILADEAGMGKSASIINLFLEHRKLQIMSNDSVYNLGVYINLHDFQLDLKDCSIDGGSEFLSKVMKFKCEISSELFGLMKSRKITFFIDSFDEISKGGQKSIIELLKKLKSENEHGLRILIATRNDGKDELEEALKTKAYNFHKVSTDEQISFLANYWKDGFVVNDAVSVPESEYQALLLMYIAFDVGRRAVDAVNRFLGGNDAFIGIPLQLVMLATIHADRFQELASRILRDRLQIYYPCIMSDSDWNEFSQKLSSSFDLYEKFINQKLNIWLDEKLRFERKTECIEGIQKMWMNELLCQIAFLNLSSSYFKDGNCPLPIDLPNEKYCDDINSAGLCETILEWKKIINIPENLFKRLRKTRNVENAQNSNIVFLTFSDESMNNGKVEYLLKKIISAEIVFGNDHEFVQLCSSPSSKEIHRFKEDHNSNINFFISGNVNNDVDEPMVTKLVSYELSDYSYRFIHQTLGEYFMAKCIVSLIDKGEKDKHDAVEFLKVHYHEEYFRKIRYFLDSFLCKDIPALDNLDIFKIPDLILNFDQGLSEIDWKREDSLGRNILHYAVAYGNYFVDGIFWMIGKNFELFHKKDKLGASCLSYFLLSDHQRETDFDFAFLVYFTSQYLRNFNHYDRERRFHAELFYSIFVGTIYSSISSRYYDVSRYISEEERKHRHYNGDLSYERYVYELNHGSPLIRKKLEINIKWIMTWERPKRKAFLRSLFVHNSQALSFHPSEFDVNLDEWLVYCLDRLTQGGEFLAGDIVYASISGEDVNSAFYKQISTKLEHTNYRGGGLGVADFVLAFNFISTDYLSDTNTSNDSDKSP